MNKLKKLGLALGLIACFQSSIHARVYLFRSLFGVGFSAAGIANLMNAYEIDTRPTTSERIVAGTKKVVYGAPQVKVTESSTPDEVLEQMSKALEPYEKRTIKKACLGVSGGTLLIWGALLLRKSVR